MDNAAGDGPGGRPGKLASAPGRPGVGALAAAGIGVLGALAIAVLNGLLSVTSGLLAVAAVTGYLVSQALRGGRPPAGGARTGAAVAIAVLAVLGGALGAWLVSLPQGGILGPAEYLAQTMGLFLPVQAVVAGLAAWLGSR